MVEQKIKRLKPGRIIVQEDLRKFGGTTTAINMALSRLTQLGRIRRLAPGIYYKPNRDPLFGEILPSAQKLAETIARKHRVRIRPSGIYALHQLGISTQVPTRMVFLTDGQHRVIPIGKTEIIFKPTSSKKMSMRGPLSSLVIQALEELGTKNLPEAIQMKLMTFLNKEDPAYLEHDLALAPARIHDFIYHLLKKNNVRWGDV